MTVAILQKSARESRKLPVAIQNGKIATGFKKCQGKKKNTGFPYGYMDLNFDEN